MSDKLINPEDSHETYAHSIGLELPKEVNDRFHRRDNYEEFEAAHPDCEIVSWSSQLAAVWSHVSWMLNIDALPPPLCIDRRKNPPRNKVFNDDGTTTTNYIVGLFNSVSSLFTDSEGRPDAIYPYDYELRVFEENFKLDVKGIWGSHVPREVFYMHMSHLLMHECLHYSVIVTNFAEMQYTSRHTQERLDVTEKFYNHILNHGTKPDEAANELKTILFLKRWMLEEYEGNPGIAARKGEDIDMQIVLNGPFDRFMQRKDPSYCMKSTYLMWLILNWCEMFDQNDFPMCNLPIREEWDRVRKLAIKFHHDCWRAEKFKYVLAP